MTAPILPGLRARVASSRRVLGAFGVVGVLVLWWVAAETIFARVGVSASGQGGTIPNPIEVAAAIFEDGISFYLRHVAVTVTEAGIGYAFGVGISILLAAIVVLAPRLNGPVMQVAVISYCIPIVAIGPIVRIITGSPLPGQPSGTAVFLAGMLVVFTTLIGTLLGLRAAEQPTLDIVTVYGGGRWKRLKKVQFIAALPAILNALKIAAPLAVLGAVIGEYLGGVGVGIGPALVNAQQSLEVPRAWALAVVTGLVSGAAFGVLALVARIVTPWSRGTSGGAQ